MRLQLSIHRHTLPPTYILFSTGSGPASHTNSPSATIADLLHDVNDLVPLESEDGEWGLEDYTVEVAATADQEVVYEALHYQSIESVLREDDEVVVRYLGSEELRSRRLGGRLQISGDGRHLVDGVVWGRRWVRGGGRPGVGIPPRKRRRVLVGEEEVMGQVEGEQQLLAITAEEEMEDDDYVDEDEDNEVRVRETFDDADEGENEDDEDELGEVEQDEIQLLLEDAAEIENAVSTVAEEVLERQLRSRTGLGKRKRDVEDDGEEEVEFQGFSTPVKSPGRRQVQFEDDESDSEAESPIGEFPVEQAWEFNRIRPQKDDNASDIEYHSSSESPPSESEDESMVNGIGEGERESMVPGQTLDDETSSSGSSSSELESETSESSDSSLDSDDDTSSSGSDSESESETSSSSESDSEGESSKKPAITQKKVDSVPFTSAVTSTTTEQVAPRPPVPPGQGKPATQKRNNRTKRRNELKRLKEQGLLPAHAKLEDLRLYQSGTASTLEQSEATEQDLEATRLKVLASVQGSETVPDTPDQTEAQPSKKPSQDAVTESITATVEPTSTAEIPKPATPIDPSPQSGTESSTKRARLDVAASRRLLFGSLGLRTPKTSAEEQALREKLAKSAREQQSRRAERSNSPPPEDANRSDADESWKEKLVISVVECNREGVKMDPPPFPFEQRWMQRRKKVVNHDQELDYGDAEPAKTTRVPDMTIEEVENFNYRVKLRRLSATLPNFTVRECYEALQASEWIYDDAIQRLFSAEASQGPGGRGQKGTRDTQRAEPGASNNGSRTVSFAKDEVDGMPIPNDFEALAGLEKAQVLPGTTIAYKELHVSAETGFQPEVSAYRVARVTEVDNEGVVKLTLAVKDRDKRVRYDPETGERIVNNFEIHTSQEDYVDDGVREIEFNSMMAPKLIEAAVQVHDSSNPANLQGGDADIEAPQHSSEAVPESVPAGPGEDARPAPMIELEQIEIDTPRRQEIVTIINDAGFNSTMHEQLLDPFSSKPNEPPISSLYEAEADKEHAQRGMDSTIEPAALETAQKQPNDWTSSAPFPPAESSPPRRNADLASLSDDVQPTSSPPVSPQLTVEYPHISQMDLDSSLHVPHGSSKNSSSHQDAQRVPQVLQADVTLNLSEGHGEISPEDEGDIPFDDEPIEELQSKVPQSQSQSDDRGNLNIHSDSSQDAASSPNAGSFLGKRGYDGPADSSYHDSNDENEVPQESDSESSLPSLTELTSSQRRKISSKKTIPRRTLSKRVSPPPVTRKGLRSGKTRKKSTPPSSPDGASDLPPSSQLEPESSLDPLQREIKTASSQMDKRLSQIPASKQIVDLTLSSDPVSPDNSDEEYGRKKGRGKVKKRGAVGVNGTGKANGRSSMIAASVSDVGSKTGLGTKRFLTVKKSRSQI